MSIVQADQTLDKNTFDDADDLRDRSSSNEPTEGTLENNLVSRLKDNQAVSSPRHSSIDLMCYKVLGIIGKVILAVDTTANITYVLKVSEFL